MSIIDWLFAAFIALWMTWAFLWLWDHRRRQRRRIVITAIECLSDKQKHDLEAKVRKWQDGHAPALILDRGHEIVEVG